MIVNQVNKRLTKLLYSLYYNSVEQIIIIIIIRALALHKTCGYQDHHYIHTQTTQRKDRPCVYVMMILITTCFMQC